VGFLVFKRKDKVFEERVFKSKADKAKAALSG
jgi:hypothetical protein